MLNQYLWRMLWISIIITALSTGNVCYAEASQEISVNADWDNLIGNSRLSASAYIVNNPKMRRDSSIRKPVISAIKDLEIDNLRYMTYFSFRKLSIPELYPPKNGKTSWDFSLMDEPMTDMFKATSGRSIILTLGAIPDWMFKGEQDPKYPDDPNTLDLTNHTGKELADPSGRELADYIARIVSWYTMGGFTDEFGERHTSGYYYKIPYLDILNEPEVEIGLSPESYTRLYDAIVEAVRKVSPRTKFIGLSAGQTLSPDRLQYFLNSNNHKPHIPLDYVSYHFYAKGGIFDGPDQWQYNFFRDVDDFVKRFHFMESDRLRLAPSTGVIISEAGVLLDTHMINPNPPKVPHLFWNASGASFAYLYANLAQNGVSMLHMAQGIGYAGFFPELTLFDSSTGAPNARYWVLKLLAKSFRPGDVIVKTEVVHSSESLMTWISPDLLAQGFCSKDGIRRILLVNKRNKSVKVILPVTNDPTPLDIVDEDSGMVGIHSTVSENGRFTMKPFAVGVATVSPQNVSCVCAG